MNYEDLYSFSFRIENVGVKDVGDFKDVVSELRYYFVGTNKNNNDVKERFAVHSFDVDHLDKEQFIPFDQVSPDMIHDWLSLAIRSENLDDMKKDIHLMFNPPIRFYNLSHFNPKTKLKQE